MSLYNYTVSTQDKCVVNIARLPPIYTIKNRIRNSENFPRIRDAEIEMKRNEKEFLDSLKEKKTRQKRIAHKKKEKKRRERLSSSTGAIDVVKMRQKQEIIPPKKYFNSFVLDKDPQSSKYMPFDTVYFPKLFDKEVSNVPPESLDKLWLIGFEDLKRNR